MLAIVCFVSFSVHGYKFNTIVAFGDSLSDNGNLYQHLAHLVPKSPPYYKGRFSNGPVWVETLFENYFPHGNHGYFLNYAVGGAGAVFSYKEQMPYILSHEITSYLYSHYYNNKDKSLYTIWIGANNYLSGPTNVNEITTDAVNAISDAVEKLIDRGGMMYLIINLPNIGTLPRSLSTATDRALLTQLTLTHNQKLLEKCETLREQYPNVKIVYLDVYKLFEEAMENPQKFGLKNTQDPCYTGGYTIDGTAQGMHTVLKHDLDTNAMFLTEKDKQSILNNPMVSEALRTGWGETQPPNACDTYLFWDRVHPTAVVHRFMAEYVELMLKNAGIEPI